MDIVRADQYDHSDPHGYCKKIIPDTQERFRIKWRRVNLSNEIRELHIMHDCNVIPPPTNGYFNKDMICQLIDDILEAQKRLPCEAEAARRKLFFTPRTIPRKAKTTRKIQTGPTLLFKRKKLQGDSSPKIKKNYLDEARQNVLAQIESERLSAKRRQSFSSADSPNSKRARMGVKECPAKFPGAILVTNGMFHVKTETGLHPLDPSKLSDICKYHDKMVRHYPEKVRTEYEQFKRNLNTEACRLSRRVSKLAGMVLEDQYRQRTHLNSKIIEESIRSIHYLKSLLDMLLERVE